MSSKHIMKEFSKGGVAKIHMHAPVLKTGDSTTGYVAILSDDSVDRDQEIVGKTALEKIKSSPNYTVALVNHKNEIESQVGEWINKRILSVDGHNALVAEPKFYLSNPKAKMIKGMLDEGATMGVSIGAIPKAHDEVEIKGENFKRYTDLELLEASFVAIPANSHARAVAVAKSFRIETKGAKLDSCVQQVMNDPDFKPKEGRTREEAAFAVCNARLNGKKKLEVNEMEEKELEEMKESYKTLSDSVSELKKMVEELQKADEEEEEGEGEEGDESDEESGDSEEEEKEANYKAEIQKRDAEIKDLRQKLKDQESAYKQKMEQSTNAEAEEMAKAQKGLPIIYA